MTSDSSKSRGRRSTLNEVLLGNSSQPVNNGDPQGSSSTGIDQASTEESTEATTVTEATTEATPEATSKENATATEATSEATEATTEAVTGADVAVLHTSLWGSMCGVHLDEKRIYILGGL